VRTRGNRFLHYMLVSALGLALYNGMPPILLLLTDSTGPLALNLLKIGALGAALIWNFFGYWRFVFQPPAHGNAAPQEISGSGSGTSSAAAGASVVAAPSGDAARSPGVNATQPRKTTTGKTN